MAARELLDVAGPITLSPGHLHELARAMLNLTAACEGLHRWGLGLLVAAARQRPGDVHELAAQTRKRANSRLARVCMGHTPIRNSPFCSGSWSLRLSFVTHLRYNEPDRRFPFPHRLLHAASA